MAEKGKGQSDKSGPTDISHPHLSVKVYVIYTPEWQSVRYSTLQSIWANLGTHARKTRACIQCNIYVLLI